MGFKRRRSEDSLLQDKPSDLLIITADSEQPIEAHSTVLGLFSKVVDDLPRASTTAGKTSWDLCQLVLEGQSSPVASAVVQSWLDLVYSRVDKRRQPPKVTSLSEAARSLLLFADAVGTCSPVMDALGEALAAQPMLTLPVTVNGGGGEGGAAAGGGGAAPPPQLQLQLALSGKIYFTRTDGAMYLFNIPYQPVLTLRVLECMPHELLVEGFVAGLLNDPTPGQVEIAAGSKLTLVLTGPVAATCFAQQPSARVEAEPLIGQNFVTVDAGSLNLRAHLGGLPHAEQRHVLREVLQQLEEDKV
ncbi:hypothetical protein HYH02_004818 [Chlamydomonas schloesseri]|uniref:Uncharacterized protein n=1 Tax=Chlamydomonas schloesseri TaxID=2026947 RepID=A0A835WMF0_9CHLO|nr:hypothetical protein HYH02_004818 [Chlamydomonas schloesseri]|eukprot:KAG2450312.1 hypothetical protein HYH02_004818 [Chlamydomonas schloesseri]